MDKRPLKPDDIFELKSCGDVHLSPDGKHIIYVTQYHDKAEEKSFTDLYLASVETGESRKLTNSGKDRSPKWSPDGKKVAFVSSRSGKSQIWMIDPWGGEAWRIPTKEAVQGAPIWSSDGKRIFFTSSAFSKPDNWVPYPGAPEDDRERALDQAKRALKPKDERGPNDKEESGSKSGGKPNDIKVITRLRYRMDGSGYFGELRRHVFSVDAPDSIPGEDQELSSQITSGDFDHSAPCVTPNGKYIIVPAVRHEDADYIQKSDLYLFEVETGKSLLLYDGPGPIYGQQISPDGKYIAFLGHDRKRGVSTRSDLWILPVGSFLDAAEKGEEPRSLTVKDAANITAHLDRSPGSMAGADPGYGSSGPFLIWEDSCLFFPLQDHGEVSVCKAWTGNGGNVPGTSWNLSKVLGKNGRAMSAYDVKGETFVYQASSPTETESIFLYTNGAEKNLTEANREFMKAVATGQWEKFQYHARDGQELDGWLLYPHEYEKDKRYPMVLMVHGGPHGAYSSAFMFTGQFFASHGYVVAYCNPRGSTSYGQEFMACIDADWGNKDFTDVMSLVDAVTDKGIVDESNMFVYGWSYGGYWTAWAITQTSRFKAACAGACVSNLHSDYGTSDIMWADEHEYGGKPWEDANLLLSRSPLSHVPNVTTPVLLLHGENDLRCPISHSEQFYIGLKRLGKTAVMIRYPGEFHGLRRHLHRTDRLKRMLAWFDYWKQQS